SDDRDVILWDWEIGCVKLSFNSRHRHKISLVCKDAGTRPAYMFALRYPTRVTGVISIGISHSPSGSPGWLKELLEGFYINRWREPGRAKADFGRLDAKTVAPREKVWNDCSFQESHGSVFL
nr:putative epoxide hydrolase [Tanacetum cinerariifolium]